MIQTAMMTRRLKAADPTMVEGPSAPAKKFPATTSMTDRIISGAEEPSAMRDRLAMVGFQTCTSVIPKPKMSNNRVCVCVCVLGGGGCLLNCGNMINLNMCWILTVYHVLSHPHIPSHTYFHIHTSSHTDTFTPSQPTTHTHTRGLEKGGGKRSSKNLRGRVLCDHHQASLPSPCS